MPRKRIVAVFQMSAATWPALDALVTDAPWAMVCLDEDGNLYNLDSIRHNYHPGTVYTNKWHPVAGPLACTVEQLGGAPWLEHCRKRGWLR